jgi:N-acetylglucosamine-6-phosphate deacetylase
MTPSATPPGPGNYLLTGTVVTDGYSAANSEVAVVDGFIAFVGPLADLDRSILPELEPLELPDGSMILPGLVDLHCHGAAGGDFPSGNLAEARAA